MSDDNLDIVMRQRDDLADIARGILEFVRDQYTIRRYTDRIDEVMQRTEPAAA